MSGYAWDLSPIDDECAAYAPGHLIRDAGQVAGVPHLGV